MPILKHKDRLDLIKVLASITVFNSREGRNLLLGGLSSLESQISRNDTLIIDLTNIIDFCNKLPLDPQSYDPESEESHPLALVIENARALTANNRAADEELGKISNMIPLPPRIFPLFENQNTSIEINQERSGQLIEINQERSEQLKAAFGIFLVEIDDIGDPELLKKAKDLRWALQAENPDIVDIENLYRYFTSLPNAEFAVKKFFKHNIIRNTLIVALTIEHSWKAE
jgi:hypothetical protein